MPRNDPEGPTPTPPFTVHETKVRHNVAAVYVETILRDANGNLWEPNSCGTMLSDVKLVDPNPEDLESLDPPRHRLPLSRPLDLRGPDGNAWVVMGFCQDAARRAGRSDKWFDAIVNQAQDGDYETLISVLNRYFKVK